MIICFLACVKSGRAYCPIDVGVPLHRVHAILDSVQAPIGLACNTLAYTASNVLPIVK